MLQLLIGASGSGKSETILSRLDALTEQEQQNILWLVPEQHSFESERALLRRLGAKRAARVQVLSFSRLADRVFAEVGGLAGQRLDDGTRALLMSRAVEQVAAMERDEDDPARGKAARLSTDVAYVEQLLSLWQELRQCAVTAEDLAQTVEKLEENDPDALLTEKAGNMQRVFAVHEALAAATGVEDLDELTRLAQRLPQSQLPNGAAVFVDGFKGFTQQELLILEQLMTRCAEMTVALTTDTPGKQWAGTEPKDYRREYTLFSPVTDTIDRLNRLAADHGMAWELTKLTHNRRTDSAALQALEAGLYHPVPTVYDEDASEVTVTPCTDVYEECRYAVRSIHRLMRQGYRLRDMAVAVRRPADYAGILDDMLTQAGIPCYMDERQDLLCEPLVAYIRAALRLAVGGWRTEELLRLMKTDLWTLSPVEIARMENYVYIWGIDGKDWDREWTDHPDGAEKEWHTPHRTALEQLNTHRRQLMESLGSLRRDLRGSVNGRQFAMAVYTWLTSQGDLSERILRQAEALEEMAQPVLADHATRLWGEIINILDRFALALGDCRLPVERMEELFTMLCRMLDMGSIPQGLDAVTVGGVDRIRYNAPRAVLVLGANEGVLPAYPAGDGLLTEAERRTLKELGLTLAEDLLTQCVEERFYAYLALSAPSEQLVITYQTTADTGPSPLIAFIKKILPHHHRGQAISADGQELETADEMFRQLAQDYAEGTAVTASLQTVLADHADYGPRQEALERAVSDAPFRIQERDNARGLFGTDMVLSASKADVFFDCKFKYFCRYGLRLNERRKVKVDRRIFGEFVHYAMETLLPVYCQEGGLVDTLRAENTTIEPDNTLLERLQKDTEACIRRYVDEEMGGTDQKDGSFRYQMHLAARSATAVMWHTLLELQQSDFNPIDYELKVHPAEKTAAEGEDPGVVSLRLPTSEGCIQFSGKVDRVDLYRRDDGVTYVRVVDYKTGGTTFALYKLAAGMGMQMLNYLYTVCDNSDRYLQGGSRLRPGGVLYHPVEELTIKSEEKSDKRITNMQMNGLVLNDADVVDAMQKDQKKTFCPAYLDKEHKVQGSVATLQQFDVLRKVMEDLLVRMGESLLNGDVAAAPVAPDNKHSPCSYCEYRPICGRDADEPAYILDKQDDQEVMEQLERKVNGNGHEA